MIKKINKGYGVPTNEVRLAEEAVNCPATPKSQSCTFPSAVNKIFAANICDAMRMLQLKN